MMKCERCGAEIPDGEEMEYYGHTLCEECYMLALSPARACDPWAVHSAKSLSQMGAEYAGLSETQERILDFLRETNGAPANEIAQALQLKPTQLQRELATLRHMERVRGEMRNGKKLVILW